MYEWPKPHLSRSLAVTFESLTFYSLPSVRFFPSPHSKYQACPRAGGFLPCIALSISNHRSTETVCSLAAGPFVAGLYATSIPCTALSSLSILRNRGNPEFEILLVASPLVSILRLPLYGIPM